MSTATHTAVRLTLTGRVQGLGVRPAIVRWAGQLSLTGWVVNTCQGIEIVAEGTTENVERFARELPHQLPFAAVVESQRCNEVSSPQCATFEIRRESTSGLLRVRVPQDLVVCENCRSEIQNSSSRRSNYPFTSCTECGPRFSIIESMPFERDHTTMRRFPLCASCQSEFNAPEDRRFHAETNACLHCGPRWWCRDDSHRILASRDEAFRCAAQAICRGKIVAVQGLGGYQLIVDATSESAVLRLRNKKHRLEKPFAVMVPSLGEAHRLSKLDDVECQSLRFTAGPIVVTKRRDGTEIARSVSPGLDTLGLMLPTTPVHMQLLADCHRPLVVTSGNVDGNPLEFEHESAGIRLAHVADLWLEHDRPIRRPIDDSVVRVIAGQVAVMRSGRGFAPFPLEVDSPVPLLAVGGHQKGAIALSNGVQAVLGPHVGDLDTVTERERWEKQVIDLGHLYGVSSPRLVGDRHSDYASTRWANEQRVPFLQVQHHHAHVVAGMIEHKWLDRTVLGVAFDGTGLGGDGTVWGGEFLLASATGFRRIGHLLPFCLPGGEKAIHEPWRTAVSLVHQAAGGIAASSLMFQVGSPTSLLPVMENRTFSPKTTSAGRLFDGIAALVMGVEISRFEGQGPMLLEAICDPSVTDCYSVRVGKSEPFVLDWRPAVVQVLRDLRSAVAPGVMASRFHRGLAFAISEVIDRFSSLPVVLSGGCFQNRLLVEWLVQYSDPSRQRLVGTPGLIPINDGGLAAGQLAIGAAQYLVDRGLDRGRG